MSLSAVTPPARRRPPHRWIALGLVHLALAAATPAAAGCIPDDETLCLLEGRFAVTARWRLASGREGAGRAVPLTGATGAFWFFDDANYEVMLKVLDGREVNGRFWVFLGSLSNVEFTATVTDTATGASQPYFNPPGNLYGLADIRAFPQGPGMVCAGVAGIPCPEGLFCDFPAGTCDDCCDLQGTCLAPPDSCPEVFDPVCGCDGVTYGNDCERQAAEVSLDHVGACEP